MSDPVYRAFLEAAAAEAAAVNTDSDTARLVPDPRTGHPPRAYHGLFRGVEHLRRTPSGGIDTSSEPVAFTLCFPPDYLRSSDPLLQFRVATIHWEARLVHPNVDAGGLVCLGPGFRPGTRLRPLVEQVYGIVASRVRATDHAFEPRSRDYFLNHIREIESLRAPPLWRRAAAKRIRVRGVEIPDARARGGGSTG